MVDSEAFSREVRGTDGIWEHGWKWLVARLPYNDHLVSGEQNGARDKFLPPVALLRDTRAGARLLVHFNACQLNLPSANTDTLQYFSEKTGGTVCSSSTQEPPLNAHYKEGPSSFSSILACFLWLYKSRR